MNTTSPVACRVLTNNVPVTSPHADAAAGIARLGFASMGATADTNATGVKTVGISLTQVPVRLRMTIEEILADTLTTPPPVAPYDYDLFEATWFTRWRKDGPGTVGATEVTTATVAEVQSLRTQLHELADKHGFCVELTQL